MKPIDFLSGPVADALGWTLLHALWQGFALVLPTAIILHLLRHRSSDLRYRMGVLALLAQLLISAVTFAWYYEPVVGVLTGGNGSAMTPLPVRWQAMTQTLPWHQQVQQFLQTHLGEFVLVYLIGVALFGLRLAGGWLYLQRLSRTAAEPATTKWTELTNALRAVLAIRAVVRVRESARIAVPMVVGVLKPVLLLPIGLATNLSIREVEAVLAHELAHVKRHDYAVNLLQSVMEVLYFFHPALWWLSARVREEREHCCDDLAVQAIGGDGRILAQALARVEELRLTQATTDQPALAMALATKRQQLLHRVRRMLGVPTRPFVSNSSLAGLTLATVLLVSVSVYAVQQQDKPQPKPKPRTAQPQATRRHTVDTNSEYGMVGERKISYVIWKGQKLPASRVARLQRQLDQVMAGQLNLDNVKQPDRDILLKIIETNNAFDGGMDGLAAGLTQLDYNTIIKTGLDAANAAGTFPVDVDSVLSEVEKADYNRVIDDAMAGVSQAGILDSLPDKIENDKQLWSEYSRLFAEQAKLYDRMKNPQSQINNYYRQMEQPWGELQKLQTEIATAQNMASRFRQDADKFDLPTKRTLLEKATEQELRVGDLSRRIRDVSGNKIRLYSDSIRLYSDNIRVVSDSIRKNGEKIRALSQQLQARQPRARTIGPGLPPTQRKS